MGVKIKVPAELVPSQSNQIMLRSKYIYDDVKGHTQEEVNAALEEQIESKVIEAGGVNWDTVPTSGSDNAVKSKDIKAALEKVTGYFVLDNNVTESTVAKTVTVANFPSLSIGGSIKIKMPTKNTADNPTLRIGPDGALAYPLYYNGVIASALNTWEADEIISVFFDGTKFMASNSQGSKTIDAEKVVMNNENFMSDNVDAALTELFKGGVEIDLTDGTTLQKSISGPIWGTGGYSSFIDMTEYAGQEISITANATYGINYAFTSSAKIGNNNGAVTNIVSGRAIEIISAGDTVVDIVPDGTSYLCLRRSSTSSAEDTDMLPESVMIGETAIDVSGGTILKARMVFPSWSTGGSRRCSIIPLPYGGRTIEITANDTNRCTYAFFKDNTSGSNGTAVSNFAKNSMTSFIAAGKTVVKEIPANATHLYLFRDYSSLTTAVAYMPKRVFVKNILNITADSVRYSDHYNQDSNVQKILESVNIDINGIEVLDKSTFTERNNDIVSPPLLLYKGDTITIIGQTSGTGVNPIVRWYDDYSIVLVSRTTEATSYTYTANEDMYIIAVATGSATFTITRANKRLDNIEKSCNDIPNKLYLSELLGNARKAEYETIKGSYIKGDLTIATNGGFYTRPVALSTGETMHLYCGYNGWSIAHLVKSDSEGNLISSVGKTITSTHYTYRATEDCYIVASGVYDFSIIIVSNNKMQDYIDDYDARTKGTSILDFYANKQTENMLRQLTWGYNANLNMNLTRYSPLCLLHFSDIHNNNVGEYGPDGDGVSNIKRIVTFFNKYKKDGSSGFIHDAIHTGDSVYSSSGNNFPWTTNEDIAKILNVMGNHDLDGTTDWPWLYSKFFAPYIEGWGVTVPEDAAETGKCYYYKDYTANNIRLIALMDWMWLGGNALTTSYHSAQDAWFQEVLEDARTKGLTVVCAVHVAPQKLNLIEGCTFNSWECKGHGDAGSATANRYAVSVDSFIQAGGDFACWIGGHTHFDLVGTLESYPDQLCILIENAGCWSYYDTDHRITGTLSQDCFNVMSIDSTLKRVNVMRIGSNFASAMQHKGAFSYDYKNKKLLNCW